MGLKSIGKKLGKVVKTAAKAYVTYQTGGLAGVALSAASKLNKKAKPVAMPGGVMIEQGGFQVAPGVQAQEAFFPAIAAATRVALPALARGGTMIARAGGLKAIAKKVGGAVANVGGAVAAGTAANVIIDAAGNRWQLKKKRRRINPMNVKAARRAIRRIKGVRKITAQIERQLPTKKSRAAAHCPPPRKKH